MRISKPFIRFLIRRILQAIPLILAVIVLNFFIIHLAPGDPAEILAGEMATPEWIEKTRKDFGLDKPLFEQLLIYVGKALRGDLGYSYTFRQPVLLLIAERVPATLLLMGTALIIAVVMGIVLGVISSKKPYSLFDNFVTSASLAGYSIPIFWLGQVLMLLFVLWLPLFPVGGMTSLRQEYTGILYVADVLRHLLLPALTLSTWYLAIIFRLTRSTMLQVLREDFIVLARSKGLDENTVFYRHALKNGLLPIVTFVGMTIGLMLGGAVLTETVFGWPGLGRLMYVSMFARDYPVLLGILIFVSTTVILSNLITDIVYALVDPRISYK
jgi:peptide/nickel transport system permease protein